jgi:hypothetical protein
MKRRELEMALRAAGRVARETEFYLIGSQAIHAYCRRPPAEVLLSQECDLYPRNRPETANLLDSRLGRGTRFARQRGFYVDVVTPEIASLPTGWQARLKRFRAGRITALCLEIHDLVVSKLAAGRLKDLEFVGALLQTHLANPKVIRRRVRQFPVERDRARLRSRLQSILNELG